MIFFATFFGLCFSASIALRFYCFSALGKLNFLYDFVSFAFASFVAMNIGVMRNADSRKWQPKICLFVGYKPITLLPLVLLLVAISIYPSIYYNQTYIAGPGQVQSIYYIHIITIFAVIVCRYCQHFLCSSHMKLA